MLYRVKYTLKLLCDQVVNINLCYENLLVYFVTYVAFVRTSYVRNLNEHSFLDIYLSSKQYETESINLKNSKLNLKT